MIVLKPALPLLAALALLPGLNQSAFAGDGRSEGWIVLAQNQDDDKNRDDRQDDRADQDDDEDGDLDDMDMGAGDGDDGDDEDDDAARKGEDDRRNGDRKN